MLPDSDRLNVKHPDVIRFCRHLGEGYYVTTIYRRHVLDFRKHYVMRSQNICTIFASKSGIRISMQDEWNDLLHNVIPAIPVTTQCLPTSGLHVDVSKTTMAAICE